MNSEAETRLKRHCKDFEQCTGRPFEHFYCPILHEDTKTTLQRGHIINEAFQNSARKWVIQRKDVDNFFASPFESDFEVIQNVGKVTIIDIFTKKKLYAHFNPRIYKGDTELPHIPTCRNVPGGFYPYTLKDSGRECTFLLKIPREDLELLGNFKYRIVVGKDMRLSALICAVKAAHLTMFSMFGYRYVLSNAGKYVGYEILGRFVKQNRDKDSKARQNVALNYFRDFKHMIRPISGSDRVLEGTISDGEFLFCGGVRGAIWGMMVIIKTAHLRIAVILPLPGNSELMAAYIDFVQGSETRLRVMPGRFDYRKGDPIIKGELNPDIIDWPKSNYSYPGLDDAYISYDKRSGLLRRAVTE